MRQLRPTTSNPVQRVDEVGHQRRWEVRNAQTVAHGSVQLVAPARLGEPWLAASQLCDDLVACPADGVAQIVE